MCAFGLPAARRAGDGSSDVNWTIIFEDSVSGFVPSDRPEIVPQLSGPDLVLVHPSTSVGKKQPPLTLPSPPPPVGMKISCHQESSSSGVFGKMVFLSLFSSLSSLSLSSPNSPGGNQALVTTEKHCVCVKEQKEERRWQKQHG